MKRFKHGDVPCNGCTLCCEGDAIRIMPYEDSKKWKTQPHPVFPGELMLAHNEQGDCIYLTNDGCSVHDDKPELCRTMDCRVIPARVPYAVAKKKPHLLKVWKKGKQLLQQWKRSAN